MSSDINRQRSAVSVWGLVVLLLASPLQAAEPPGETTDNDQSEKGFSEQSIYIPYSKLREIFEKEGRGVFLPYEQFQELWQAARATRPLPRVDKPPVDALITEVENEATVSQDVVRVSAHLKIEILAEGWNEIPLRLNDAAIMGATIGDQPARIVFEPAAGYKLLIEKTGKQADLLELSLEYAKAYTKTPGQNSVSFLAPQAPVSRWRISIPEAGVKVNIHPLIAATEVPEDSEGIGSSEQTVVLAFVGAAPAVRIDWTPKAEGATGLQALVSVQSRQQVRIDQGVTRTRTHLTYDISRAEISQLVIEVPAEHKVVNVFDANIRQWSVEKADERHRITAQLFEHARKRQSVTIELENFTDDDRQQELKIPVIRSLNVGRQYGVVVIQVAPGLRAEALKHTGLLQIDTSELPDALTRDKWEFSYRYTALPYDLILRVEKVEPRIVVESLVEVFLEPEQLTLDLLAVFQVERAGVFRLEFNIPPDYEVQHVRGSASAGAQAAHVDTYHLEGEEQSRLVVNLARKALGKVGLAVELQKRLSEPDLLSPTGRTTEIPLNIPRVAPTTVEQASGRLVIYAPESLRVNPAKVEGIRSVSFTEAYKNMESIRGQRASNTRAVLAYVYTQQDVVLSLAVERRKPYLTARQLLVAKIEAGVVKYEATLFYDILYSGVKSLRIDVPADLAREIHNNTPGVRKKVIDPPPEELAEGYVAWSFSGETEFLGSVSIRLAWEMKIEKLEVGKSVELKVPHLKPKAVDRAWGQIVLTKAETIDVRDSGEPQGIRPIDPQHDLMAGADVPDAARAFEFHDDWALDISVTRYQLEEVKRTSIERAVLRMVVTRSDQMSVQALYRMRSARQRLAVKLPGNVEFDSEPLRINGRPVALERGEKDDFFVPLVGLNRNQSFLLELRYTISGSGLRLDYPVFPSEPAVQKVYLCAYLPRELAYLGSIGPWNDELTWRWNPAFDLLDRKPIARYSNDWLINWVSQGINTTTSPADTFQVDGRLYLFSTLRPSASIDGSLRLIAVAEHWLNFLIFAPVILGGLFLLRKKAAARWLAVGAFIVLLVLLGVFFPTLSLQVIDGKLLLAIFIILVVWLVHYAVWIRPFDPAIAAVKQARQEAKLARIQAKAGPAPFARAAEPPPPPKQSTDKTTKPPKQKKKGTGKNAGGENDV